ncbi:MAG: hypothetical protein VKL60_20880 [Sphaerospermopsis sp.]|nr:hypothetical protein [Sphaerospermopsis sp.]
MKNLLSIVFLFCLSLGAMAQSVVTMTVAGSPVTNGGTATATATINNSYETATIQAVFAKTSGTLGGTATLQASLDGTNYATVPTAATVAGAATYTVTDVASQSVIFIINKAPYKFYRISWTGTGTMVGTLTAYILPK